MKILFVGEKRSTRAEMMNWTWQDRRLSGKSLFDAFQSIGIDSDEFDFCNVFEPSIILVEEAVEEGTPIVAMGKIAQSFLSSQGIDHFEMIHPAARGRIRKNENYARHVADVISMIEKGKEQAE